MTTPLQSAVCPTPQRRHGRLVTPALPPRCSARLAKKAHNRTPTLLAAQNVLLKKLNITKDAPSEPADIQSYIDTFNRGLTVDEARLIAELFIDFVPIDGTPTSQDALGRTLVVQLPHC